MNCNTTHYRANSSSVPGDPTALLVAQTVLTRLDRAALARKRSLALAVCATFSAVGLIVLAVLLHRARPLLFALTPSAAVIGTSVIVIAGVGLACIAWFGRYNWLPGALATASIATLIALHYTVYSAADLEPVQRMARIFAQERQHAEPSATYQAFVRNLVFYTNVKQTNLDNEDATIQFLNRPERVLCVLTEDALLPLEQQRGVKVRRLGSVLYFNPSGVRLRTLFSPQPEHDLETVWLISNR